MQELETYRQGIGRRLAAAAAVLAGASFGSAAAAHAETRTTTLSVSATVLPSCLVSTEPRAGASPATVSCRNFGSGSIAVERDETASESSRFPRSASPEPESVAIGAPTYITVTY